MLWSELLEQMREVLDSIKYEKGRFRDRMEQQEEGGRWRANFGRTSSSRAAGEGGQVVKWGSEQYKGRRS